MNAAARDAAAGGVHPQIVVERAVAEHDPPEVAVASGEQSERPQNIAKPNTTVGRKWAAHYGPLLREVERVARHRLDSIMRRGVNSEWDDSRRIGPSAGGKRARFLIRRR
jgi:hypothetical protein